MKKGLLAILSIFSFYINSSHVLTRTFLNEIQDDKTALSFIFSLEFPIGLSNIPVINGYYKGEKLKFEKDFCIINEDTKITSFTLIVTEQIKIKSDGNNIKYLEMVKEQPCKFFYITQVEQKEGETDIAWKVEEEVDTKLLPSKLPDNSIVIVLDPSYVQGLKTQASKTKNIQCNNKSILIKLPTLALKIKENEEEEDLLKAFDYAALATLELNAFHAKTKEEVKNKETSIISMRTN
ncbi:hypothetical protein M1446_04860 [Candidatus Dependentiae bacterium]|nr:hypothetical protein [Candidatus Dependentiae bacterium]